jgi:hypothetical protein
MPESSSAAVIFLGGWRGVLITISIIGYVVQYLAFRQYYEVTHGDGWRELGPGLAVLVFCPVQVATALSLLRAYGKALSEGFSSAAAAASDGVGGYGLDDVPFELERARRHARIAVWTLSVPAIVMAVLTTLEWLGAELPGASILAGPMTVVWLPVWSSGVVAALTATNRLHDSSLLWQAALYPALALAYANS